MPTPADESTFDVEQVTAQIRDASETRLTAIIREHGGTPYAPPTGPVDVRADIERAFARIAEAEYEPSPPIAVSRRSHDLATVLVSRDDEQVRASLARLLGVEPTTITDEQIAAYHVTLVDSMRVAFAAADRTADRVFRGGGTGAPSGFLNAPYPVGIVDAGEALDVRSSAAQRNARRIDTPGG